MSRTFARVFALFALAAPLGAYTPPTSVSGLKLTTSWSSADFRHGGGVLAISVAREGIASGGKDGFIRLWRRSGEEVRSEPHGGLVLAAALAPDGARMASAGLDGRIAISNTGAAMTHMVLRGHKDWVQALAWAPDGTFLISAARNQEVRVWNTRTGRLVHTIPGTRFASGAVAISPDTKVLAATTDAGTTLWTFQDIVKSSRKAKPLVTLPVHPGGTTAIAFEPRTPRVITTGADGELAFWRLPEGKLEARVPAHRPGVSSLAISPDGLHLATAGGDDLVKIWALDPATNPANMRCQTLRLPEGRAHAVAFLDDTTVLAGTESGAIVRLPVTASTTSTAAPGGVVALAADATTVAVAETSRVVRLRDIETGQPRTTVTTGELTHALAWAGDRLAIGGERAQVELVDPAGKRQLLGHQTPWVSALAVSPDKKTLASGAGNATVVLRDIASAKELTTLLGHRAQITGIAYLSPDRLLTVSRDRRVGVWSVSEKKAVVTLAAHQSAITALAVNHDGSRVLTGGENGEVFLWAPPEPNPVVSFKGAKGAITALAFIPGKDLALVADADGQLLKHHVSPQWPATPAGKKAAVLDTTDRWQFGLHGDVVTAITSLPGGRILMGTARGCLLVYR